MNVETKALKAHVVVVGAGPAGSAAAAWAARAGSDVLVIDSASFPRDKACGDGLTPRAVKQLVGMGIPLNSEDGWFPNKGLRIIGGGVRLKPIGSAAPRTGSVRLSSVRPHSAGIPASQRRSRAR